MQKHALLIIQCISLTTLTLAEQSVEPIHIDWLGLPTVPPADKYKPKDITPGGVIIRPSDKPTPVKPKSEPVKNPTDVTTVPAIPATPPSTSTPEQIPAHIDWLGLPTVPPADKYKPKNITPGGMIIGPSDKPVAPAAPQPAPAQAPSVTAPTTSKPAETSSALAATQAALAAAPAAIATAPASKEISVTAPKQEILPAAGTETKARSIAAIEALQESEERDLRAAYKQSAIMQSIRKLTNIVVRHDLLPRAPLAFSYSGYIKNDLFFDSRQVDGTRQDHFLYFPEKYLPDVCGRDINDKGRFNMVSIETRGRGEAAGPIIFGARSFGAIEADFYGNVAEVVGLFRLRHAFLYFMWPDKTLLLGQYWHPVFIADCYPDTISFNNGVPIEPYQRQPQIRITKTFDNIHFMFAATSYSNQLSDLGIVTALNYTSNLAERNAIMPDLNMQARMTFNTHFCGIGINCRRIIPFLVTTPASPSTGRRTRQDLFSFLGLAYAKFAWDNVTLSTKLIYAQNGIMYDMISGYAAHCIDPITQMKSYTNLQCVSFWFDLVRKGIWEPGLFAGITKNLGADTTIIPTTAFAGTFDRQNIDYVFRIQPRLRWFVDPFIFGGEFEITQASWGTSVNDRGLVVDARPVTNYRLLLASFFCF